MSSACSSHLPAGDHTVRFSSRIPPCLLFVRLEVEPDSQVVSFVFHVMTGLPSCVTLSAYGVGLVLLLVLALIRREQGPSRRREIEPQ
jgi:hypothetical protein